MLRIVGWLFAIAILLRDVRSRLLQTECEQVQSRLRNLFVSRSPHMQPYLSDTIFDDWPTPYFHPRHSFSYRVWPLMAVVASVSIGGTAGLAALALWLLSPMLGFVIFVAAAAANYAVILLVLHRLLRRKARQYKPQFPEVTEHH